MVDEVKDKPSDEKLDKILTHLDALHSKCDALTAKHDAMCSRIDALEESGSVTDLEAAARKDAEEKARKDAEERERADKARADANAREQADLPKYIEVQKAVDEIAQAFGDSVGAARWMQGESLDDYTRRLLTKYKPHSKAWKDVDLTHINGSGLTVATKQIRADAIAAAALPEFQEGRLIERSSRDKFGRTVTRFYGDARVAWAPFSYNGMVRKIRIRTPLEVRALQGR